MDNISIQPVHVSDIGKLQEISVRTFQEAFAETNTPENIQAYINKSFSQTTLTRELHNPQSEFYFAFVNDELVGYLKLNSGDAQTEYYPGALEIERIYILRNHYGKSIGRKLFNQALAKAQQRSAEYIWLGVWEHNNRAINFYRKLGFIPFDKHTFQLGDDKQTDILMKFGL